MESFQMPASLCPSCGKRLDACTQTLEGQRPREGDMTICIKCAAAARFGPGMKLVAVDSMTLDPLMRRRLGALQKLIRSVKEKP